MATEEAKLEKCMLVQDLDKGHWDWSEEEKKSLGNCKAAAEVVKKRLEAGGCQIEEMYAIVHDKDEKKLWDEVDMNYKVKMSAPHIHILVKFKSADKGETLKKIAELAGIKANYIEKPKRGRWAYDNMLSYLTHIKYAKKFQYKTTDVATICGKPYSEYFSERHEAWIAGRRERSKKDYKERCDEIINLIMDNPSFDMKDICADDYDRKVYMLYPKQIKSVLEARHELLGWDIKIKNEKSEEEQKKEQRLKGKETSLWSEIFN